MESFFQKLRQRWLDRIAVGYAVAGWIAVQAASIVLPSFEAPPWTLRAIIIFVLSGFPFSLLIGWFAVPHFTTTKPRTWQQARTVAAIGVSTICIIVVAADLAYSLSRIQLEASRPKPSNTSVPAKNSIAVLPFLNMSGDPSKEYFSDGISEELLNDLANVPQLLVAARTSSFAFKGKRQNIREIARILAVRSVLEGSVRESGNRIRITAQLINADDGYHLWSATYNAELTDVLVVQDTVAQAITAALTHELLPHPAFAKSEQARTISAEAYRAFLLAKRDLAPRTREGSEAAELGFKKVTDLAPDFAEGYAQLARAQINVAEYHPERDDLIPAAQDALAHALAIDPRNMTAVTTHLDLSLQSLDWSAAMADARRMQDINANSWVVRHEMFRYYQYLGFPDLALVAASGAAKLDPLSFVDRLNVVAALFQTGNFSDAISAAQSALNLEPNNPEVLMQLCAVAAHVGDIRTALAAEQKLSNIGDEFNSKTCQLYISVAVGRRSEAREIVDHLAQTYLRGGIRASEIAWDYLFVGDFRRATHWLDLAYERKELQLFLLPVDKYLQPAVFESRAWKDFYRRPLFESWRKAHDGVAADIAAHG